jgi:hypothetical protein
MAWNDPQVFLPQSLFLVEMALTKRKKEKPKSSGRLKTVSSAKNRWRKERLSSGKFIS